VVTAIQSESEQPAVLARIDQIAPRDLPCGVVDLIRERDAGERLGDSHVSQNSETWGTLVCFPRRF
jgi:hypothetical protein